MSNAPRTMRCEQSNAQALEFKERAELAEAQTEALKGQVEGLKTELQTKAQATQSLVDCKRRIEGDNSQLKKGAQDLRDRLGHAEARHEMLTGELAKMNEAVETSGIALEQSQEQNETLAAAKAALIEQLEKLLDENGTLKAQADEKDLRIMELEERDTTEELARRVSRLLGQQP